MNNLERTPGPWLAEKNEPYGWYIIGGDDIVCELSDNERNQDKPNAHLIAAAPEMLEALKASLKYWWGGDDALNLYQVETMVEKAVKKAEENHNDN